MTRFQLRVYVTEVQNQVEAARLSAEQYNRAMQVLLESKAGGRVSQFGSVFLALQGLLTAAASISKLLWPGPASLNYDGGPLSAEAEAARQVTLDRGRELRAVLGAKDVQILQRRAVRNALEHFDERLDAYLGQHNVVVDRTIGDPTAIDFGNGPAPTLRVLDPSRGVMKVMDDEVVIQDLMDAMKLLEQRATDWQDAYLTPQ